MGRHQNPRIVRCRCLQKNTSMGSRKAILMPVVPKKGLPFCPSSCNNMLQRPWGAIGAFGSMLTRYHIGFFVETYSLMDVPVLECFEWKDRLRMSTPEAHGVIYRFVIIKVFVFSRFP